MTGIELWIVANQTLQIIQCSSNLFFEEENIIKELND